MVGHVNSQSVARNADSASILLHPIHGGAWQRRELSALAWDMMSTVATASFDDQLHMESDMAVQVQGTDIELDFAGDAPPTRVPLALSEVSRAAHPRLLIVRCNSNTAAAGHPSSNRRSIEIACDTETYVCRSCLGRGMRGFRCKVTNDSPSAGLARGQSMCPQCAGQDSSADTWLLIVNGGEQLVQTTMAAFAKAGAIRTDLTSSFQIHDTEIARGSFAAIHRMFPRGWSFDVDDGAGEGVVAKFFDPSPPEKQKQDIITIFEELSMLTLARGHPNIVGTHGLFHAGDHESTPWPNSATYALMMDFCGGGDLWSVITKGDGIRSEQHAGRMLHDLLSALDHIHSKQMIHRDVKVENILIASDGRPILADFGLAALKSNNAEMSRRCGSPGYVAPEVLLSMPYDEKVDVFAVGVVLYFMVYGKMPFDGGDVASVLRRTIRNNVKFGSSSKCGLLSSECRRFGAWLLTKRPQDRPEAQEALAGLWFSQVIFAEKSEHDEFPDGESARTTGVSLGGVSTVVDSSEWGASSTSYGNVNVNLMEELCEEMPNSLFIQSRPRDAWCDNDAAQKMPCVDTPPQHLLTGRQSGNFRRYRSKNRSAMDSCEQAQHHICRAPSEVGVQHVSSAASESSSSVSNNIDPKPPVASGVRFTKLRAHSRPVSRFRRISDKMFRKDGDS